MSVDDVQAEKQEGISLILFMPSFCIPPLERYNVHNNRTVDETAELVNENGTNSQTYNIMGCFLGERGERGSLSWENIPWGSLPVFPPLQQACPITYAKTQESSSFQTAPTSQVKRCPQHAKTTCGLSPSEKQRRHSET